MRQHDLLVTRARERGIAVGDVSAVVGEPAALLGVAGRSELVVRGVPTSWISARSRYFCDNKQLTKRILSDLGLPFLESLAFDSANDTRIATFLGGGGRFVCKPLDGTDGEGVQLDVTGLADVADYCREHAGMGPFLLEQQGEGTDLRLQIIGGQVVAACVREPAFVVGDGTHALAELLDARRAVMATQNPANALVLDASSRQLLEEQAIGMEDVPARGRRVVVKRVANIAQGGVVTDVTDALHPDYRVWGASLSRCLQASYLGVDILTTEPTADPVRHARVLELNARAEWLHHTFSEVRTHDVPALILDVLLEAGRVGCAR